MGDHAQEAAAALELVAELLDQVGLPAEAAEMVTITPSDPVYGSPFPIARCSAAAIAAGAAASALIWRDATGVSQTVHVDMRRAATSLISFVLLSVDGQPPAPRDDRPMVDLYQCGDGRWIHLHGSFPGLAAATATVLGIDESPDRAAVTEAVRRWSAQDLEDALASAGTCGAMLRTADEWADHPQGQAVGELGIVQLDRLGDSAPVPVGHGPRPLSAVRVLDLTRVLAGPACGRALAEHGADVMLVNSPNLPNVPGFVIDTTHGKLSVVLDLDDPHDADTLRTLAASADVFAQGYRSGSLARRGFGIDELIAARPDLINVSINCYGDTGPWRDRPGWEQLAQTAIGIVAETSPPDAPSLMAAAACDYTTGNLAALGTLAALWHRGRDGGSFHVRASLCQTGSWFTRQPRVDPLAASGLGDIDPFMTEAVTPYGIVRHMSPVAEMSVTPTAWDLPSVPIGTHPPVWP